MPIFAYETVKRPTQHTPSLVLINYHHAVVDHHTVIVIGRNNYDRGNRVLKRVATPLTDVGRNTSVFCFQTARINVQTSPKFIIDRFLCVGPNDIPK